MKKEIVGLLFGSPASEYSVSLHSAAGVIRHFPFDRYELRTIAISQSGKWLYAPYTAEDLDANRIDSHPQAQEVLLSTDPAHKGVVVRADGSLIAIDKALLILHGKYGEGGLVQGMLSALQMPYTGCDAQASMLCMDKELTHLLCDAYGIAMTPYRVLHKGSPISSDLPVPCVVKPANEGSSYGVSIVHTEDELSAALSEAFRYDDKILVEDFVQGVEVGCSMLEQGDEVIISHTDMIDLGGQDFFDFEEKYHTKKARIICPAPLTPEVETTIRTLSRQLTKIFNLRGFARLDFFLRTNGQVVLNEINTIPGMTPTSRFPSMMMTVDIDYTGVIVALLEHAHC